MRELVCCPPPVRSYGTTVPLVDPTRRRMLAVLLAATALLTVAGFLLKAQCIGDYDTARDRVLCSNDLQVLYLDRALHEHAFPYVHGGLVHGQPPAGTVEYPVLTGVFAWLPAQLAPDDGSYLQLSALLLAPFSLVTVLLLGQMVRWRALVYALAPPLVWYSFHNWDLLVVCATVAALHAFWRERWAWCGGWLAVGAGLKFWPLLLVLPLLLHRLHARDRSGAVAGVGAFVAGSLAINLPFLLLDPGGWFAPYAFQQLRGADVTSNSIWYWGLPALTTHDLNRLIPVLLALATLGAAGWGWRRAQREGEYPVVQVGGALLAAFMLLGKAHSPQYALWLLPFFCLLRLRWGWWLGYFAVDALTYVGVFRWFYDLGQGRDFGLAKQALVLGVWGRAVALVLLYAVFLTSRTAWRQAAPAPVEGGLAWQAQPA